MKKHVGGGSPDELKKKKRKTGRGVKGRGKGDGEKGGLEAEAKDTVDEKVVVVEPAPEVDLAKPVQMVSQPKSAAFKAKKWLATRRRSNSKPAAVKA